MKNWDMNRIIALGLVIMGTLSIGGWIAYSILTGSSNGTELPIAIASGLNGVLTGKNLPTITNASTTKERDNNENIH